jgi:hypothetical protein
MINTLDIFLISIHFQFIVDADINGDKGPIKLGGVTPLYRSRRDRKNGPKLYLETRFSPKAYVKVRKTIILCIRLISRQARQNIKE